MSYFWYSDNRWIPKEAVHLYYAGNWNKQTQTEFYEKKQLNLHHNFVDVVQSKRTNLADGNDNIADQTSKGSALLLAQSADPIVGKLKVSACNSICDIETVDSASLLMNDDAESSSTSSSKCASSSFIASSFISNEAESTVSRSQIELQAETFNLPTIGSVD